MSTCQQNNDMHNFGNLAVLCVTSSSSSWNLNYFTTNTLKATVSTANTPAKQAARIVRVGLDDVRVTIENHGRP